MFKPEISNELIEKLHEFNRKNYECGYAAMMVMRMDDGSYDTHIRTFEPCYGFLRRYKSTHGDKCTQPEHKPDDLPHPFPDGTIVAVAVPNQMDHLKGPFLDYVLGDTSPYIAGFNGTDRYQMSHLKSVSCGIVLLDTEIDPTVFINLMKCIHVVWNRSTTIKFAHLLEHDMTEVEAFVCCTNNGDDFDGGGKVWTYVNTAWPDMEKLETGKVNDFSNGTWKAGFDYSRRNIQDIFKADKSRNRTPLHEMFNKEFHKNGGYDFDRTPAAYAAKAKEVLKEWRKG